MKRAPGFDSIIFSFAGNEDNYKICPIVILFAGKKVVHASG